MNTRAASTASASVAMASLGFLCIAVVQTAPAWSHNVEPHPHAENSKAIDSAVPAKDVCRTVGGQCDVDHGRPEHGSLAEIGAKLSDPTSNVWALQFNIQGPTFYDGDLNLGDPKLGANVIFQPVPLSPLRNREKSVEDDHAAHHSDRLQPAHPEDPQQPFPG